MNTKLKCLLLDDELPGLSYLKLLCEQIPELEVVRAFNDPEIFLKEYSELDFDLCIMDIEMPGTNGVQLASLMKDKLVIFTTAYKDYATNAFDLDAIDFVVKPVKIERLQQAIHKAIQRFEHIHRTPGHILLNTANGTYLQLKNISFEKLISSLPSTDFCRINKKELIALRSVMYYSNDQITTNINIHIEKPFILTLGETYRADFLSKINR